MTVKITVSDLINYLKGHLPLGFVTLAGTGLLTRFLVEDVLDPVIRSNWFGWILWALAAPGFFVGVGVMKEWLAGRREVKAFNDLLQIAENTRTLAARAEFGNGGAMAEVVPKLYELREELSRLEIYPDWSRDKLQGTLSTLCAHMKREELREARDRWPLWKVAMSGVVEQGLLQPETRIAPGTGQRE